MDDCIGTKAARIKERQEQARSRANRAYMKQMLFPGGVATLWSGLSLSYAEMWKNGTRIFRMTRAVA
jgi:hypothetical protein